MEIYAGGEIKLDYAKRPGGIFMDRAKQINSLLEKINIETPSLEDLGKIWVREEELRKVYTIPVEKSDAYDNARQRLEFMRVNPQIFHQDDTKKRAELEKQKADLAKKIDSYQVKFSRAEDSKRLESDSERDKIKSELAVLDYKKKKYEDRKKNKATGCFPCGNKNEKKLMEATARIAELTTKLNGLKKASYESLSREKGKLEELRHERMIIDKALSAYDSAVVSRARRYQNAMNNLEIVMKVRELEIDEDVERHYGAMTQHMIHVFLKVYTVIKDGVTTANKNVNKQNREIVDLLNKHVILFDQIAETIYCPKAANRSLMTLYKKMGMLRPEDREQVIKVKPIEDRLPPALVRTFSVKNFRRDAPSLGLFREVISKPAETLNDSGTAEKGDQLKLLHQMAKQ